jgi:hypothetical protein
MMDRRAFISGITGGLLAAPLAVEAQQTGSGSTPRRGGRLPRVGYLGSGHPADRSSRLFSYLFEAFADGLREGGYVDGQTVIVEYRFAEGRFERLPALAGELVRLGVDVIFAPADHTAVAARQATPTIPSVFTAVTDPVARRFTASRAAESDRYRTFPPSTWRPESARDTPAPIPGVRREQSPRFREGVRCDSELPRRCSCCRTASSILGASNWQNSHCGIGSR